MANVLIGSVEVPASEIAAFMSKQSSSTLILDSFPKMVAFATLLESYTGEDLDTKQLVLQFKETLTQNGFKFVWLRKGVPQMATFKSVLSGIGHFFEKVFTPGNIAIAASVVDIVLPQFSTLTNAAASAVINAENASIAAGKQSGSGAQKSAFVITAIEAQYEAFAKANGIPVIPANVQKYVDATVLMLNSFPMPVTTPAPTTTVAPTV
jgi:hypothetical protein